MSERRVLIHQHLSRHPGLSADELARALHLASGGGIAATLTAMRRDGEAYYVKLTERTGR